MKVLFDNDKDLECFMRYMHIQENAVNDIKDIMAKALQSMKSTEKMFENFGNSKSDAIFKICIIHQALAETAAEAGMLLKAALKIIVEAEKEAQQTMEEYADAENNS